MFIFFFFQAEDGIRDLIVTGVQTCALPISRQGGGQEPSQWRPQPEGASPDGGDRGAGAEGADHRLAVRPLRLLSDDRRSEERRVGKECRSRWASAWYKRETSSE